MGTKGPYSIRINYIGICSIRALFYRDQFYKGSHKPLFYRDLFDRGSTLWGSILQGSIP